jgi:hypothetical protein
MTDVHGALVLNVGDDAVLHLHLREVLRVLGDVGSRVVYINLILECPRS